MDRPNFPPARDGEPTTWATLQSETRDASPDLGRIYREGRLTMRLTEAWAIRDFGQRTSS